MKPKIGRLASGEARAGLHFLSVLVISLAAACTVRGAETGEELAAPPMEPPAPVESAAPAPAPEPETPASDMPSAAAEPEDSLPPVETETAAPIEQPTETETTDQNFAEEDPAPAIPAAEALAEPQPPFEPAPSELTPEQVLASPTRSIEKYEEARRQHLHESTLPRQSINVTVAPRALAKVDLRAPTNTTTFEEDPNLLSVLVGYDHTVYKRGGITMLGIDAGLYGSSTKKDPYSGLLTAFVGLSPHVQYQGLFMARQWVVPTVKLGYDFIRYDYSLQNKKVRGFRTMPRFELGLLVFLNILEPSSAGQMQENYGIKRTYLSAYYSISRDSSKQDFDLSENTLRVGLRFEL